MLFFLCIIGDIWLIIVKYIKLFIVNIGFSKIYLLKKCFCFVFYVYRFGKNFKVWGVKVIWKIIKEIEMININRG